MNRIVQIPVSSGGPIIRVEVDEPAWPRDRQTLRGGSMPIQDIVETGETFESILDGVKPSILAIYHKLNALGPILDSVEVVFSIKITAEAGIVFAKANTEGNFQVSLSFKPKAT